MVMTKTGTTPRNDRRRRNTGQTRFPSVIFQDAIASPHTDPTVRMLLSKDKKNDECDSAYTNITPKMASITELSESPLVAWHIDDSTFSSAKKSMSRYKDGTTIQKNRHPRPLNPGKRPAVDSVTTETMHSERGAKRQRLFSLFQNITSIRSNIRTNNADKTHDITSRSLVSSFGYIKNQLVGNLIPMLSFPKTSFSLRNRIFRIRNPLLKPIGFSTSQSRDSSCLTSADVSHCPGACRHTDSCLGNTAYIPPFYTKLADLVCEELGGRVIYCTDDFFSSSKNVLQCKPPKVELQGTVDGWETRRKRSRGHNWCLVELGIPGYIYGVEINTRYFTDNCAPCVSVEAANIPHLESLVQAELKKGGLAPYSCDTHQKDEGLESESIVSELLRQQAVKDPLQWRDVVPMVSLTPSDHPQTSRHFVYTASSMNLSTVTHLRLNLFPDGGLARLRTYGVGACPMKAGSTTNMASVSHGAIVIGCSNEHGGSSKNLLLDSSPQDVPSGWLTARNPGRYPYLEVDSETGETKNLVGEDWVIIKLASKVSCIGMIDVDTSHFIGNHPYQVEIQVADVSHHVDHRDIEAQQQLLLTDGTNNALWTTLLPATHLKPDTNHHFYSAQWNNPGSDVAQKQGHLRPNAHYHESRLLPLTYTATHIKMIIYPDGGVARLRVWIHPLSDKPQ